MLTRVSCSLKERIQNAGDFLSVPQKLIAEAFPSQKCPMNMGPMLNCYGGMGIEMQHTRAGMGKFIFKPGHR